jgi:hypothetical protein
MAESEKTKRYGISGEKETWKSGKSIHKKSKTFYVYNHINV